MNLALSNELQQLQPAKKARSTPRDERDEEDRGLLQADHRGHRGRPVQVTNQFVVVAEGFMLPIAGRSSPSSTSWRPS